MLHDVGVVGLSLISLKIFIQHRPTFGEKYCHNIITVFVSATRRSRRAGAGAEAPAYFVGAGVCSTPAKLRQHLNASYLRDRSFFRPGSNVQIFRGSNIIPIKVDPNCCDVTCDSNADFNNGQVEY